MWSALFGYVCARDALAFMLEDVAVSMYVFGGLSYEGIIQMVFCPHRPVKSGCETRLCPAAETPSVEVSVRLCHLSDREYKLAYARGQQLDAPCPA